MTISLQRFAITGDTNYVSKHNANVAALESAFATLEAILAGITGGGVLSLAAAFEAMFGTTVAVIGKDSYACSGASTTLTVQAGYCWRPLLQQVLSKVGSTTISFSGLSAATYYVQVDATGTPIRTTDSTEGVYSVVWTGSAFGAITRLANIAWGEADWLSAQASAALAASYTSLDARLEAGEAQAVLGADFAESAGLANGAATLGSDAKLTASQIPDLAISEYLGAAADQTAMLALTGQKGDWCIRSDNSKVYVITGTDPTSLGSWTALSYPVAQPYDLGGGVNGQPTSSLVIMRYPFPRSVIFPAGLTGSYGGAGTAATAQTDFDIQKNGASVGTMRFAAAGTTATFIMASQTTFAAGDVLKVVSPATPDATLADIGFSLVGTR